MTIPRLRQLWPKLQLFLAVVLISGCATVTQPPPPPGRDITGTRWKGTHWGQTPFNCHFEPNGILSYVTQTGTFRNGHWQQRGSSIYMETNHKFSEYFGVLNGTSMSGTGKNVRHETWNWTLTEMR